MGLMPMQIAKVTGTFGAYVTGIDVAKMLGRDTVDALRHAIDEFGVLFYPDQAVLTAEEHLALAAQFGEVETPPLLTRHSQHPQVLIVEFEQPKGSGADVWHQDGTYLEQPPMGTFLQAQLLPASGGDTCFACMYSAYEALSPSIRAMLDGLTAQHSAEALIARTRSRNQYKADDAAAKPPVSHPVVTVNPATGRRRLFVNSLYTTRVNDMSELEALACSISCSATSRRRSSSCATIGAWAISPSGTITRFSITRLPTTRSAAGCSG